jgi:hypothetical protein
MSETRKTRGNGEARETRKNRIVLVGDMPGICGVVDRITYRELVRQAAEFGIDYGGLNLGLTWPMVVDVAELELRALAKNEAAAAPCIEYFHSKSLLYMGTVEFPILTYKSYLAFIAAGGLA